MCILHEKICAWMNIKIEVQGRENLDVEGPAVLLCNHQSSIDTLGELLSLNLCTKKLLFGCFCQFLTFSSTSATINF